MKTKHILLGLSLGLLGGFTACDVTDLNPKDSITDNSYWNTVSDLENYAKGFYMNLTGKGLRADGSENLDDLNTLDERSDNRLVASPDQWFSTNGLYLLKQISIQNGIGTIFVI